MLYQVSNKLDAGVSSVFYPIPCCLFIRSRWYEGFRSWHSCIKSKSTCFCLSDRRSCTEASPSAIALHHTAVPFDFYYCPPIQGKLNEGICPKCGMYWPSKAGLGRHVMPQRKKECLWAGGWSNASAWQYFWNFQISIRWTWTICREANVITHRDICSVFCIQKTNASVLNVFMLFCYFMSQRLKDEIFSFSR